jgi:hypothetical protein
MEKECFLLLWQQSFYKKNELSDTILSTTRSPPLTVPEKQGKAENGGFD